MMISQTEKTKYFKHSEVLRVQRKARQLQKNRAPLLSYRKRKPWQQPNLTEALLRPTNPEKDALDRLHFGNFSSYRALPQSLEVGINRENSIEGSRSKVVRMPWLSFKDEKEQRRKEREKEHLSLARRKLR